LRTQPNFFAKSFESADLIWEALFVLHYNLQRNWTAFCENASGSRRVMSKFPF